ncbi:MAG: hypothetical protein ACRDTF_17600 [Pseudonocardiaceae bacterium]
MQVLVADDALTVLDLGGEPFREAALTGAGGEIVIGFAAPALVLVDPATTAFVGTAPGPEQPIGVSPTI